MTNENDKSQFVSGLLTSICHCSFFIGHLLFVGKILASCHGLPSAFSAVVRKNVAPASSRQTVLLTQKELSRLTCRRDAGATILSHDPRLCGEVRSSGFSLLGRSAA